MKTAGYTLVELLVVIAIVGILGGFIISNAGKQKQDSVLNRAFGDLQSRLTIIQSNAASNLVCPPAISSLLWYAEFKKTAGTFQLETYCVGTTDPDTPIRVDTLNIASDYSLIVCTDSGDCQAPICSSDLSSGVVKVTFDSLSGRVNFSSPDTPCFNQPSVKKLVIDFKNVNTGTFKTLTVNKGGVIN